jgi:hypothetical protein
MASELFIFVPLVVYILSYNGLGEWYVSIISELGVLIILSQNSFL